MNVLHKTLFPNQSKNMLFSFLHALVTQISLELLLQHYYLLCHKLGKHNRCVNQDKIIYKCKN